MPGAEIIAPREHLGLLWKNLHASVLAQHGAAIGMRALNALRLEAGIPWFPDDFNDTVIPHEAALEATHISFTKGCYTGQEIVERVRSRGQVNRRRVQLKFSSAEAPAPLTRLYAHDNETKSAETKPRKPNPTKPKKSASSPAPHFLPRQTHPSEWATFAATHSSGAILDFNGGTVTVVAAEST